jgi:large subunit ribosomal protein L29
MKASNLREMRQEELRERLMETEKHLFDLRCQSATENIENTCAVKNTRRDIARIKTILREQQNEGR